TSGSISTACCGRPRPAWPSWASRRRRRRPENDPRPRPDRCGLGRRRRLAEGVSTPAGGEAMTAYHNLDPRFCEGPYECRSGPARPAGRTRTARTCWQCGGTIAPGSEALATAWKNVHDRRLVTTYCHHGKPGLDECHDNLFGQDL